MLPNVPTIAEAGAPGYVHSIWYGIWAPAGTPAPIVAKLATDIAAVLSDPELVDWLAAHGAEVMKMTQPEFERFARSETESAVRLSESMRKNRP
jgi:tripartite-type tricarboxylate transporter receptor subunit TctC